MLQAGHARLRRRASSSTFELTAKQNDFLIIFCLDVQVGLFQLVDLITDELCFLDLLLDLLFVAFIDAHLVIKFGADLVQEFVEASCAVWQPAMRIHGHGRQRCVYCSLTRSL